jgi:long-chain acyl-CoA synthetase
MRTTRLRRFIDLVPTTYGSKPAVGWRDVLETFDEHVDVDKLVDGQTIKHRVPRTYYRLSDYNWLSFTEFREIVLNASRALVDLDIRKGEVVNIFAASG